MLATSDSRQTTVAWRTRGSAHGARQPIYVNSARACDQVVIRRIPVAVYPYCQQLSDCCQSSEGEGARVTALLVLTKPDTQLHDAMRA